MQSKKPSRRGFLKNSAKLAGRDGRAQIFEFRANSTAVVKVIVVSDLRQAGRSDRIGIGMD